MPLLSKPAVAVKHLKGVIEFPSNVYAMSVPLLIIQINPDKHTPPITGGTHNARVYVSLLQELMSLF